MGSGLSSGSGSSSGANSWTFKVYYTPDAKNPEWDPVEVSDSELISYFRDVSGTEDEIWNVWKYCYRIGGVANPVPAVDHHFLVIESVNWYWSFEKDKEGIFVQRSKDKKYVKERYRGKLRDYSVVTLRLIRDYSPSSEGRDPVQDIIKWIYQKDKLNEGYHFIEMNCQRFAAELFNAIVNRFS